MTKFGSEYKNFIDSVGEIAKAYSREKYNEAKDEKYVELIDSVLSESSSDYAITAIEMAVAQVGPTVSDQLLGEMEFFNNFSVTLGQNHCTDDEYKDDINSGEEVKGSLEDILGDYIPGWLKKVLKVLNELLSILKGA